jgi:D-alanyl-D-alanine carboxypeptidase
MQLGKWIGDDGAIFGYSDMVFYLPAKRVSVVVITNAAGLSSVPAQAVWGQIVNKLCPGAITSWPTK